jgi:hypothetical protein
MNYLLDSTALHLHPEPRRGVFLKRSGVIPPKPGAGRPPIAVRARRRSLPRVLADWSVGRRWGGPPGPGTRRPSAGSGASPIASGATRGVAFLVDR